MGGKGGTTELYFAQGEQGLGFGIKYMMLDMMRGEECLREKGREEKEEEKKSIKN